jgi:hypothetical protein
MGAGLSSRHWFGLGALAQSPCEGADFGRICRSPCLRFNAPVLINKKKQIIAGHGRARLRTTHKAKKLLARAGVIADHAEQAAGGQRGSEHVHTA